jgi:hypothetical protein
MIQQGPWGLAVGMGVVAALFATLSPSAARQALDPVAPAVPEAALDADVTTTYELDNNGSISWTTCESGGCFDSGNIAGLNHACAILEGSSTTSGSTVTRPIYILDRGNASSPHVTLNVYQRTYVFNDLVTTTTTLSNTIRLPLQALGSPVCSMATNAGFVFAATSTSSQAAKVDLSDFTVTPVGPITPPLPVKGITANNAGYVVVTFGDGTGAQTGGYTVFGPDGALVESGPGAPFFGNAIDAVPVR